jgi:hypothetical protein
MVLPNFLVIGASRSGTTSLYHHLARHPQVYVTPVLEPRFFAFEGDSLAFHGPGDELLRERVVTDLSAYAALFAGVNGQIAIGEVSPAYLTSESAPARMKRYVPGAKLIAILRNPVERAISSYRLEVLEGFEAAAQLEEALSREDERRRNHWSYVWQYRRRGLYYTGLRRYFDTFAREQIRVYLYEDWQREEGAHLLRDIYRFLGVDDGPVGPALRLNSTSEARFQRRGRPRPAVSAELKADLLAGYREEIIKLQDLIDRDLSAWLQPPP